MTEVTITLSLPAKELSPNARVHWRVKAAATKNARALAWVHAAMALHGKELPRWEKAETTAVFYFATNRRRDADSASSSLKAYWDGMADAGIVANDAGLRHTSPEMCLDKLNPRVVLTIRGLPPRRLRAPLSPETERATMGTDTIQAERWRFPKVKIQLSGQDGNAFSMSRREIETDTSAESSTIACAMLWQPSQRRTRLRISSEPPARRGTMW